MAVAIDKLMEWQNKWGVSVCRRDPVVEHHAINSVAAWVLLQHSRLCATTSIHVRGRTTSAAQESTAHELWVTMRKSTQSGHKPNNYLTYEKLITM